jgi:hypothetical protein
VAKQVKKAAGASSNGFEEMVAIQLVIKGWPGRVSLTPEDVGIKPEDFDREIMNLGNKKLYAKELRDRFASIHNKARRFLDQNTYSFVLEWVRAAPKRNLSKIMAELDKMKAEYMTLAQEFINKFEEIKGNWQAKIIAKYGQEKGEAIWMRMLPHYPSEMWLKRRFRFEVNVFDLKAAEPQKGSAPEIIEAYERARAELQARYDEMVEEAVVYLRKKVMEVVNNLSSRLKEGRIVRNDTLESVRRVETWFKDLNIFGDTQVEEALTQLRAAINGTDYETLKDNETLKQQLAGLADQVAAAAGNLDDVSTISGKYRRMIDLN